MEVVIGLGVLAALYFLSNKAPAPTGTTTPALPSTVASPIIQSAAMVSGGYQLTPDGSMLASPNGVQLAAVSQSGLPSISPPTTLPPPPPYVSGGIGGGVGTGGNPLGGVLRPGVSSGTGTTVVAAPAYTKIGQGSIMAARLRALGYTIIGTDAYAPGTAPAFAWNGVQVIA